MRRSLRACNLIVSRAAFRARPVSAIPCVSVEGVRYGPVSSIRARSFFSKSYPEHNVLVMPALSPTMEMGGLENWAKSVGDEIQEGDKLASIETDKASLDLDAVEDGFLAKILVPEGSKDVPVNSPIAVIVENKEDVAAFEDYEAEGGAAAPAPAAEAKEEAAAPAPTPAPAPAPSVPADTSPVPTAGPGGRVFASPVAKKEAAARSLDLGQIAGSGPNNRVVLADVLSSPAETAAAPQASAAAAAPTGGAGAFTELPISQIRKVTAERLTEAKRNIPHYYLTVETEVDELMRVRSLLNASAAENNVKLSVNDFVIKAVAKALMDVPTVNSHWSSTGIKQYNEAHIGVAVNTEHGLFVPVVRSAEHRGLGEINAAVKDLAGKARERKLGLEEMEGGTFTISNLGAFGIKTFSAVINPPQAGILAVGAAMPVVKPGAEEGVYHTTSVMSITLSADHRVIDGAIGAQFLQAVKKYIEDPLQLML